MQSPPFFLVHICWKLSQLSIGTPGTHNWLPREPETWLSHPWGHAVNNWCQGSLLKSQSRKEQNYHGNRSLRHMCHLPNPQLPSMQKLCGPQSAAYSWKCQWSAQRPPLTDICRVQAPIMETRVAIRGSISTIKTLAGRTRHLYRWEPRRPHFRLWRTCLLAWTPCWNIKHLRKRRWRKCDASCYGVTGLKLCCRKKPRHALTG